MEETEAAVAVMEETVAEMEELVEMEVASEVLETVAEMEELVEMGVLDILEEVM
jgi:hypothetical protein